MYIDQGSDYSSIITLANQDGTVMDLTGFTAQAHFRKSYQSSSFTEFTISIFSAANGQIRLQLPASVSSSVNAGRYLYDIEISGAGEKKRVLEGIVVISPEITR